MRALGVFNKVSFSLFHSKISHNKCKGCTNAATDENSICCQKCNKLYHWGCSDLAIYNIKLHKKNPYKPWRCNSCIEKYCIRCNKTFSQNYDSICCDYCSYWHHYQCSGLSENDFQNLCDNPNSRWKCQSCTQKLCVSCNLGTHNKSKTKCCSCGNFITMYVQVFPNLKLKTTTGFAHLVALIYSLSIMWITKILSKCLAH